MMPIFQKPITLLLIFSCVLATASWSQESVHHEEPEVIRYPWMNVPYGQTRSDYFLELLRLALNKADKKYELEPVVMAEFRESRSAQSIAKGTYDIHWMHTNDRREASLLPVRIPLFKGLIGWRLLMVRESDRDQFSSVLNLDDLKPFAAVQGHDWPDSGIMISNGLRVVQASNWEGMFRMLYADRVDYFPRSVIEVWSEVEQFEEMNLAVDSHIALFYPTAYYFFVSRNNPVLAEAIEQGLELAIEDGSFEKVFMAHFGEYIRKSDLGSRRIIHLHNPLFTSEALLERPELWYQP